MTVKTFVQGAIDTPLQASISGDHFGAQILDVVFYSDDFITEVIPSGGEYIAQWSSNGRVWNDFDGTQFPCFADQPVEDWQATGYIEFIRVIPISIVGAVNWRVKYRAHRFGVPSAPSRAMAANRYFSALSTVQVSGFEFSVLQGNALSVSQRLTVPANGFISIKVYKNVTSVITSAIADGVFISYYGGDVTGDLIQLTSGTVLNTLEESRFQSSYEFYNGPATGLAATTDKDKITTPFVLNGGGVIQLANLTDSGVETFFSCNQSALGPPIVPYMLTPDTLLEGTAEMGEYNAAN